jgi:beta-aspartyl-peptidase (threonine type)
VVNAKLKDMKGSGDLITIDVKGNVAMPFNTRGMFLGVICQDRTAEVKIYNKE